MWGRGRRGIADKEQPALFSVEMTYKRGMIVARLWLCLCTRILLGISGGIASYKTAILARRLIDVGAEVRVVMTAGAQAFITPLTLQALTGNPVHTELLDTEAEAAMGHIELARWADIILIAPASANLIARLSHGFADDLLSTLVLASEAPVLLAPAMNRLMWSNAATQENIKTLTTRGMTMFGPDEGAQACGETGAGRMLEPEDIRDLVVQFANSKTMLQHGSSQYGALAGLHIVITAGPTVEPIDPVRFITNRSSGKMGFALAEAAALRQANVTLIAGPVSLDTPAGVTRIDVDTANAMLKLVRNPDILASIAALPEKPFCVGFAAETEHVEKYARGKLEKKNLDMIAANQVGRSDNPVFGSDTNSLDVYWPADGHQHIAPATKNQVAAELLDIIVQQLPNR